MNSRNQKRTTDCTRTRVCHTPRQPFLHLQTGEDALGFQCGSPARHASQALIEWPCVKSKSLLDRWARISDGVHAMAPVFVCDVCI